MDPTSAASAPATRPEMSYRIAGEGRDLFTRAQLRDRIRNGELTGENELAPEGSEDYRPASTFPELARYFSLVSAPAAALPEGFAAAVAPSEPISGRVVAAVLYPFTGIGWIILVVAAVLQSVPFGTLIAAAFTLVYTLAIIRTSSHGSTTMPPLSELGGAGQFFTSLLKAIGVVIGSAWPIILAIPLTFVLRSSALPFIAGFVILIYLPAAMAALAKWNSLVLALTPSSIFRMISTLGTDYLFAIVMMLASMGIVLTGGVALARLMAGSQLAAEAILTFFWYAATFYAYHLIGWGMYRHQDELL